MVPDFGGATTTSPVVTGLENPDVAWAPDSDDVAVLTVWPGPDGSVAPGARRSLTRVNASIGAYPQQVGGDYQAATLLTHDVGTGKDDVLLLARSGGFTLDWLDEQHGTLTGISSLPAQLDPDEVDVAAALMDRTRHAGPPPDPVRRAALLALAVGLAGLVAAVLCTEPVRRYLNGRL